MAYRTKKIFLTKEELVTKAKNNEAVNKRLHSDRGQVVSQAPSLPPPPPLPSVWF